MKSLFAWLLAAQIFCALAVAAKLTEDIALQANGFDIPILVVEPDSGKGPFPVVYHVHGGGWNGGTEAKVPAASVTKGLRVLTDELGVIHVGLGYRCKRQGSFPEAMEDLRASIKWFEARADRFNADLTRVGFSGGSAGTPLSSLLAQEHPASKTYVGFFGVYDMLNNEESIFPSEEARLDFGIVSEADRRAASVAHNLRENPPPALLFHGAKDMLTHPTQSIRYAEHLRQNGGFAEAIVYPDVNHGYFGERYPVEYKHSLLRIAHFYGEHLGVDLSVLPALEKRIDTDVAGYFPKDEIDARALLGKWSEKNNTIEFLDDSKGLWTLRKNEAKPFTYKIEPGSIAVSMGEYETAFYLQEDGRAIYWITDNDGRRNGQRTHLRKGRN